MISIITRNPNLTVPLNTSVLKNEVQAAFEENWWTGLAPKHCRGYDQQSKCLHALPLLNLDICTRQDVMEYFDNTWTLTEMLFQSLKTEATFMRSPYHQLRHPLIFYYGHPAVLFINKLRLAGLVETAIDTYLEKVLETGVDEMSWDDMSKNEMIWPTVADVHAYRKKIYSVIKNLILTYPNIEKRSDDKTASPLWALWMGFEHEKIHFETSSVLIRELPLELVENPKSWPPLCPEKNLSLPSGNLRWIHHAGQKVQIGKSPTEKSYGWDNEYGSRAIQLKDFQLTEKFITNGDFLEFIKSGAYVDDKHWLPEGSQWRKFRNTKRPTFWMSSGPEGLHDYKLRTLFSVIEMPWDWPVEVNHHEAKAYCAWKEVQDNSKLHYRLMTEAEFTFVRKNVNGDSVLQRKPFDAMDSFAEMTANFNLRWSSPSPADEKTEGNVWQLLEDQFNPLTDFHTHPLYDDFSTPCFDGKHLMIAGGSFISCGHQASRWARFHFRPHFYQHAGFRIAATLDGSSDNGSFKFNSSNDYVHAKRANVIDQISGGTDWFKNIRQPLEPSVDEMKKLFSQTQEKIMQFYNQYQSMKAAGTAHDPAKNFTHKDFKVPYQTAKNFPTYAQNYSEQLRLIFDELAPLSQLPGHPAYAAYVSGSANIFSNLAQLISQTLNPFTGHFMMAPGAVTLEAEAINWFINLFEFPEKSSTGYFTSGGSQANLAALSIARKIVLKSSDLTKAKVYASAHAHHCIGKALDFLGFPKETLQKVDVDGELRMNVTSLSNKIKDDLAKGYKPFAIIGTAGSTNTGAVDPLTEISAIAKKHNIWFHVDGAYGALFMLTESGKKILAGISLADSIAFDPHKALCLPYGTGALIVRDKNNIQYDYLSSTSYMPPAPETEETGIQVDYADLSIELSRDWRGLRVWLPIKTLGIGPFILNLEEKQQLTAWLEQQISMITGLQVFKKSQLTILSFFVVGENRQDSNNKTQALLEKINVSNTLFLSSCSVEEQKVIRICLLGHRLHFDRVQKFVNELKEMV